MCIRDSFYNLKSGITQEESKEIISLIKKDFKKAQCAYQNQSIRVSAKKRDELQNIIPGQTIRAKMEFFAMDILIPEGHKIRLSLRDIGEDYLPPSTESAVNIDVSGNSVLRLHEINVDNKIFFEPPVCLHTDCVEE